MIANTKFKHMNYQFRSDSQKIILTKKTALFIELSYLLA